MKLEDMPASSAGVSQATLTPALKALSASRFLAALPTGGLSQAEVDKLVGILLRSNDLVSQMPNPSRQTRRDAFVVEVLSEIGSRYGVDVAAAVEAAFEVHRTVEASYHAIGSVLAQQPLRKLAPQAELEVLLARLADRSEQMFVHAQRAMERQGRLNLGNEIRSVDDDGAEFSIDGVSGAFLEGFRIHLSMLAYEGSWFATDDVIVAPGVDGLSLAMPEAAAGCEALAAIWRRWARFERRRRFWAGEWTRQPAPAELVAARPGPSPDGLDVLEYLPGEAELLDWAAFERSKEVAIQSFAKALLLKQGMPPIKDISDGPVDLLPVAAVRDHELNGAGYLVTVLGQDIFDDDRRFAGLRLVEWLRGYALLGLLADRAAAAGETTLDRHLLHFRKGELEAHLTGAGLGVEAAEAFIRHASVHRRSGDLFDTPLLQLPDGEFLLIGMAALNADPGQLTLSRLNSLEVAPKDKGTVFERAVMDLFESQGLKPFTIDAKRGSETYQLDVLVPWGRFLFVIECKNRGLSDNHPEAGFYFARQIDEFVDQTQRQVEGIKAHPELVELAGGISLDEYEIVPCILFSQPFSEPDGRDGVLISDWSGLTRFFEDRYFKRLHHHRISPKLEVMHRIAIYDQWRGDTPTPEGLLRHLRTAPQTNLMLHRADVRPELFQVTGTLVASTLEYTKGDEDLDALGPILGFDAQSVRDLQAAFEAAVEKAKQTHNAAADEPENGQV